MIDPSISIKNQNSQVERNEVYAKHKKDKRKLREETRAKRKAVDAELGDLAPPARKPKTLESTPTTPKVPLTIASRLQPTKVPPPPAQPPPL